MKKAIAYPGKKDDDKQDRENRNGPRAERQLSDFLATHRLFPSGMIHVLPCWTSKTGLAVLRSEKTLVLFYKISQKELYRFISPSAPCSFQNSRKRFVLFSLI